MTGYEIHEKIEENNKFIQNKQMFFTFTLNKEVSEKIAENKYLRSICEHSFENGICIYCGSEEENN